jgi:DNA-directed RNA polymerase specialized sigma24 family protein
MSEVVTHKQTGSLTQEAFDRFLLCLDEDRDRAGEAYLKLRGKLVTYFECRDHVPAEEHADETINRVARKLGTGETIRDVTTYIYGVARLLALELLKNRSKEQAAMDHLARQPEAIEADDADEHEQQLVCFRHCLQKLPPDNRTLIEAYFVGERRTKIDHRNQLAAQFGIPMTALRLRVWRVRSKLEACVEKCVRAKKTAK